MWHARAPTMDLTCPIATPWEIRRGSLQPIVHLLLSLNLEGLMGPDGGGGRAYAWATYDARGR